MQTSSTRVLSRRHLLRGAGAMLALPLLDAMLPRTWGAPSQFKPWNRSHGPQPRMICCYIPNGVNILEWVPETTGKEYQFSKTLQVLEPHRADFTVLSGLGHPASQGGHSGADTWLTGANLQAVPGADYTNSVSMDQIVADLHGRHTRYGSLQLSDQSGTGSAGHSHTLSFDVNGTPLPAENSPQRLFERLFVPESVADKTATLRRLAEKKSILDSVREDAKRLEKTLGKRDRQKLDEYFTSIRTTEEQLSRMEAWIDRPKPEVPPTNLQLGSQPGNAHDRPMWIDVMLELAYLAFLTDTTRVITFEWSREAGGFGGGGENHHEYSHHGGDAGMLAKLGQIDRFHLSKLDRFMNLLKSTTEADSHMLDQTIIVYGSGMNSGKGGEHSPKNLPLLVAGGKKLGLKHGQHLAFNSDKHPPLSNVLLSLAQKMGVESDRFSDATGTLTGLV
ncbi:hypothetical protein Spb1_17210 [Planctopirus ephydatiae]|uniref:DUF1552 domain-containing protein n=1 Tax=Planctopirus ephydatiae TaxID=2528019 RepID=A0A518GMN3_9PLAN|nr:DUF1552 domain-containing protein [Planctopirus ephydatiae]QDV29804.1 hypothetical protein Spb1_17210 [Planctopirus ephydatiae]